MNKFVKNNHRPHHIYDAQWYFVTGRTYEGIHYFDTHSRKQIFIKKLKVVTQSLDIGIISWSLLSNHYHALLRFEKERAVNGRPVLSEFFRLLHSQVSSTVNQLDRVKGRKIWYQYWDYCLRSKKDFGAHFNYILQQPLKHGIVKTLRAAYDYPYSSNPVWLERLSEDGLWESFLQNPIKDWTPSEGCE